MELLKGDNKLLPLKEYTSVSQPERLTVRGFWFFKAFYLTGFLCSPNTISANSFAGIHTSIRCLSHLLPVAVPETLLVFVTQQLQKRPSQFGLKRIKEKTPNIFKHDSVP